MWARLAATNCASQNFVGKLLFHWNEDVAAEASLVLQRLFVQRVRQRPRGNSLAWARFPTREPTHRGAFVPWGEHACCCAAGTARQHFAQPDCNATARRSAGRRRGRDRADPHHRAVGLVGAAGTREPCSAWHWCRRGAVDSHRTLHGPSACVHAGATQPTTPPTAADKELLQSELDAIALILLTRNHAFVRQQALQVRSGIHDRTSCVWMWMCGPRTGTDGVGQRERPSPSGHFACPCRCRCADARAVQSTLHRDGVRRDGRQ